MFTGEKCVRSAAALLALMMCTSVVRAGGAGEDLLPVFAKGLAGQPLRAVAMGGSITQAGAGWIGPWMQKRFPAAKTEMVNSGMSGTGSGLGVFRVGRDVIAHDPDLVLLEFAVNDGGGDDEEVVRSMESLVVRLKSLAKPPAVVVVNVAAQDGADHKRHERVASHYGLLSIDLQAAVDARLRETGGQWKDLMGDNVHPNDKGHALYADAIAAALEPFVERAAKESAAGTAAAPVLPPPLSRRPLVLDGRMVPLETQPGWTREQKVPWWWTRFFPEGFIRASEPGTMLTLDVRATEIGLFLPLDAGKYGTFYANLDGGEPHMLDAGFRCGYTSMMLGNDLAQSAHRVGVCVAHPFDGGVLPVYLGYLLVAGEAAATGPLAHQGGADLRAHALRRFEPVPATQWEWCGPFGGGQPTRGSSPTADFERAFEPEDGERGAWSRLTDGQAFVDFVKLGAMKDRGVCYARTIINRQAGGEVVAALRLDYFAKIWVNGKLVKTVDGNHGHPMVPMFFPVEMREGENRLLIKVHAGSAGSGFGLYLLAQGAQQDPWAGRRAKLATRPRKIFAHYMGCFPIGAKGVCPGYVRGKAKEVRHDSEKLELAIGGMVRGVPLLPDAVESLSFEESADLEIRRALRAGIDGFAFMAIAGGNENVFPVMDAMFKVCEEKDYPFEITWALSGLDKSVEAIDYILKKHGGSPKLARRDGRPLMLGYQSVFSGIEGAREIFSKRHPDIRADSPEERCSPEFLRLLREGFRTKLEDRFGTPMYFQFGFGALFYGVQGKPKEERPWPEIIGFLAEGFEAINAFHYASGPDNYDAVAKAVTDKGAEWGEPMMYCYENLMWQGYRARSFPLEPGGNTIRQCWENARRNNSTLIQFTTWNDYHEATSLAPTSDTRYGLLDLNAYFVKWWKTGTPPVPDRDKLYLIYPKYRHQQAVYPFHNRSFWRDTEAMDKLEVLSILTAPARLRMPGREIEWDAQAGLSWKQIPLTPGPVAVEVLRRNWIGMRRLELKLESPEPVSDRPYREQHSMVCVSTEDELHWKQDFGGISPDPIRRGEYGDIDGDGLPNCFEMYWFGKSPADWPSATAADPDADPDGDGRTNLQEYLDRTNPVKAAEYKPGFSWDFSETGRGTAAFNPEYDRFDTAVWLFANKYQDKLPVEHGGYWPCERYGWYPEKGRTVFAPPYNTPSPSMPAGEFMRLWEGDPHKSGPSRFQVSVGLYGLQALGWRSPVAGTVRVSVKLNPLPGENKVLPKATASIEREGIATPLLAKEFAPHEGIELRSEPISVKAGETIYLVLDAAPGGARQFTMELEMLKVELIEKHNEVFK